MTDERKFLNRIGHAQIAASGKIEVDLDAIRSSWGNDFNTLVLTNTDAASAIELWLDGVKIAYITANNGTFSFDWEFGFNYNFLTLENTNGGAVILANTIKLSVGRSGKGA